MYRIWVAGGLLAIAIVVAAIGATGASARFDGSISPQLPGVGNATGVDGPGPRVEVFGGRSGVRGGTTWVEVRCTTSTGTGCSGTLDLLAGGVTRVGSASFELAELQSEGVHARLSPVARRRAGRPTGLRLVARACAADSLGRTACDSAALRVRHRR